MERHRAPSSGAWLSKKPAPSPSVGRATENTGASTVAASRHSQGGRPGFRGGGPKSSRVLSDVHRDGTPRGSVGAPGDSGGWRVRGRDCDSQGRSVGLERGRGLRTGRGPRRGQDEEPNQQGCKSAPRSGTVRSPTLANLEELRPTQGSALQKILARSETAEVNRSTISTGLAGSAGSTAVT